MSNALISILMPVKNTAIFLADCLNSIIQQTEKHWELIAINDHSTDDSLQILEDFAKKDTRIKVYTNDGNGIIAALRLAYKHSQGQLITRMDSDDIMLPEKLVILKKQLIQHGEGHLATGQVQYFSATELGDGYRKYQDWLNGLTIKGANFQDIYKECVIPSPCWMIDRADLEKSEAFQPNRYPEDYDLCFRFYENDLKVIPNNQVLHQWRDYPTRTSRTDKNYADNRFLAIKVHYFLKLEQDRNRPLVIWGAGKKGKLIARQLIEHKIDFHWVCNNERKIGRDIYGQLLLPFNAIKKMEQPQLIISVAGDSHQQEILHYLQKEQFKASEDYYFFC